jgi:hypothetical protein
MEIYTISGIECLTYGITSLPTNTMPSNHFLNSQDYATPTSIRFKLALVRYYWLTSRRNGDGILFARSTYHVDYTLYVA